MKPFFSLLFALSILFVKPAEPALIQASEGAVCAQSTLTARSLSRMCPEQLDQLFAEGRVDYLPVGFTRGHILKRVDGKLPRVRVRLAGAVWKGKCFHDDGSFINQWLGFRAVTSQATIGPSWYDGRDCIILEYPPGTAVFGNTRDELREVAPGLFLGRFYQRCPCPKLQGYFVLEAECAGNCEK